MGYLTHVLVSCLILQTLALTYGFNIFGMGPPSGDEPEERSSSCPMPPYSTTYTDLTDFNNKALAWHNYLRCVHNAPALVLDQTLITGSQVWAETIARNGALSHDTSGYGENVGYNYAGSGKGAYIFVRGKYNTWVDPTTNTVWGHKGSWYCGEYASVDFNSNTKESNYKDLHNTAHLTQIIWKGTTSVGCGITKSGSNYWYACRYSPKGNMQNSYSANIQNYVTSNYATVCPSP